MIEPPTVDEATMKLLVDRVTKSVTGKVLSNEDGRMMALVGQFLPFKVADYIILKLLSNIERLHRN
jgi:hypothetical protein